jgi:DNA-binding NarL/FixJ family response regulator
MEDRRRPIRVLLIDPEPLFQLGFGAMLSGSPDFELVGVVADGPSALALSESQPLDLFVVARSLPALDGMEIARRLRERWPVVRIVFLDREAPSRADVITAQSVGAAGIVPRTHAPGAIMECLRFAAAGAAFLSVGDDSPGSDAPHTDPPPQLRILTRRQQQVFTRVITGMSTEEIARELGLSTRTVGVHRTHITRRLGCRSAAAWVRFAASSGLLETRVAPP